MIWLVKSCQIFLVFTEKYQIKSNFDNIIWLVKFCQMFCSSLRRNLTFNLKKPYIQLEKTLHPTWKNLTFNLKKPYIQLEKTLHSTWKNLTRRCQEVDYQPQKRVRINPVIKVSPVLRWRRELVSLDISSATTVSGSIEDWWWSRAKR